MSFATYLKEQAKKNEKPKYQFRTFHPYSGHDRVHGNYCVSDTQALNDWLAENPRVEIIDWQTCNVGNPGELYITIQYKEKEE